MTLIRPPYLRAGDKVIILSPASRIQEQTLQTGRKQLEKWGLRVQLAPHAEAQAGQYAGSQRTRLHDLQQAMDDPDARAIFCSRGGYGAVHLLGRLDFAAFRKSPKWLIGFSDITALHFYWMQQGFETLHAPMLKQIGTAYRRKPVRVLRDILFGTYAPQDAYRCKSHALNHCGQTEGTLVGGNMAVWHGLRGTPYDVLPENPILFVEDVGEEPHAVERMFYNLKLGGVLDKLSGLLVGRFTEYRHKRELGQALYPALAELLKPYRYPICFGFPVGHVADNYPLIEGGRAALQIDKKRVTLTLR